MRPLELPQAEQTAETIDELVKRTVSLYHSYSEVEPDRHDVDRPDGLWKRAWHDRQFPMILPPEGTVFTR